MAGNPLWIRLRLSARFLREDSSETASSGSLTDDSVDTASEADKVTYRDLDKALASKDRHPPAVVVLCRPSCGVGFFLDGTVWACFEVEEGGPRSPGAVGPEGWDPPPFADSFGAL